MNKYDFRTVERINKTEARKFYNAGFNVLFIPCKLNPENDFYNLGIWENKDLIGQYETFEKLENAFSYYNNRSDTGKYTAFYITRENVFIHFTFTDGSNPYLFRGSVRECYKELKKWEKNFSIKFNTEGFYTLTERKAA